MIIQLTRSSLCTIFNLLGLLEGEYAPLSASKEDISDKPIHTSYVNLMNQYPTPKSGKNYSENIYANSCDVMFDHQIPSIHPIKREDFLSYVSTCEIKCFQREYRVRLLIIVYELCIIIYVASLHSFISNHLLHVHFYKYKTTPNPNNDTAISSWHNPVVVTWRNTPSLISMVTGYIILLINIIDLKQFIIKIFLPNRACIMVVTRHVKLDSMLPINL